MKNFSDLMEQDCWRRHRLEERRDCHVTASSTATIFGDHIPLIPPRRERLFSSAVAVARTPARLEKSCPGGADGGGESALLQRRRGSRPTRHPSAPRRPSLIPSVDASQRTSLTTTSISMACEAGSRGGQRIRRRDGLRGLFNAVLGELRRGGKTLSRLCRAPQKPRPKNPAPPASHPAALTQKTPPLPTPPPPPPAEIKKPQLERRAGQFPRGCTITSHG